MKKREETGGSVCALVLASESLALVPPAPPRPVFTDAPHLVTSCQGANLPDVQESGPSWQTKCDRLNTPNLKIFSTRFTELGVSTTGLGPRLGCWAYYVSFK